MGGKIDLVSHSGNNGEGEFIHSLNVTHIHTTWLETRAVLGKSQARTSRLFQNLFLRSNSQSRPGFGILISVRPPHGSHA